MSNEVVVQTNTSVSIPVDIHHGEHHEHHHHETFISKYVFSMDHKMIAKQFGVSEMQIRRIKSGENWSQVKV